MLRNRADDGAMLRSIPNIAFVQSRLAISAKEAVAMTDHETLSALNTDYINAVQNGDVRRFDEILAGEFYCSNPDGSLVDRAAFLTQTAKPVTIKNLNATDVMIRMFDNVAIIHGRTSYTTAEGRAAQGRYTDVWAKRGGQWLAVSAHVTRG
jgi:ketosteroid isomerase-like protein